MCTHMNMYSYIYKITIELLGEVGAEGSLKLTKKRPAWATFCLKIKWALSDEEVFDG